MAGAKQQVQNVREMFSSELRAATCFSNYRREINTIADAHSKTTQPGGIAHCYAIESQLGSQKT